MARNSRQRLWLEQLRQVVSRSRTRVQPRRPNQIPEEPPPRCQARHGVVELAPVQQFRLEVSFLAITQRDLCPCVHFPVSLFHSTFNLRSKTPTWSGLSTSSLFTS